MYSDSTSTDPPSLTRRINMEHTLIVGFINEHLLPEHLQMRAGLLDHKIVHIPTDLVIATYNVDGIITNLQTEHIDIQLAKQIQDLLSGYAIPVAFEGPYTPQYETPESAGMDLRAVNLKNEVTIPPNSFVSISTGIKIKIPKGFEGQVRPKSGHAFRHNVTVHPGTIDSDYRGEIKVLVRTKHMPFTIIPNMRIAQLVIAPVKRAVLFAEQIMENETQRGAGGFGSTGHE